MHADLNIFDVLFDVEGKKVKFKVVLILVADELGGIFKLCWKE